jgi:hypothetical protein
MALPVLTKAYIENHVNIELGGSQIKIDLVKEDYEHIINDVLTQLSTYRPITRYAVLHVTSGVQKYQLDEGTWGRGIAKIQRPYPTTPLYQAWPWPDPWVVSIPIHFLGDYTLLLVKQKEAEWLFGADFNWDFDATTGILLLRPPPLQGGNYVYQYLDDLELSEVRGRRQWVLDMAVASAKRLQGSKWRKFQNFPGNENQVELYTAMYEEGTDERTLLIESITSAGNAMVPPILSNRQG